jgi:hypothetical protein
MKDHNSVSPAVAMALGIRREIAEFQRTCSKQAYRAALRAACETSFGGGPPDLSLVHEHLRDRGFRIDDDNNGHDVTALIASTVVANNGHDVTDVVANGHAVIVANANGHDVIVAANGHDAITVANGQAKGSEKADEHGH